MTHKVRKLLKRFARYFGKTLMLKEITDMTKPLTQMTMRDNARKKRKYKKEIKP